MVWEGFLARTHIATGDLGSAEQALQRAEAGYARLVAEPGRAQPHEIAISQAAIAQARAVRAELKGNADEADEHHRAAIEALATYGSWPQNRWLPPNRVEQLRYEALLARADSLARAGRPAEAQAIARQVIDELGRGSGGQVSEIASATRVVVELLLAQGRPADAATLGWLAVNALSSAGGARDSALRIELQLALARADAAEGVWPDALTVFENLRTDLKGDTQRLNVALRGDPTYAVALLKAGRNADALAAATAARGIAATLFGERHPATAEAIGVRAAALSALGRRDEAMADFLRGHAAADRGRDRSRTRWRVRRPGAAPALHRGGLFGRARPRHRRRADRGAGDRGPDPRRSRPDVPRRRGRAGTHRFSMPSPPRPCARASRTARSPT